MAQREQIDILFKMHADLKEMKQLQTETKKSKQQLQGIAKTLKSGLGLAVGITSFGALTMAIKRNTMAAIDNGAAIHDNAKLYGVSAEFLQTWRYAAEQNNIQITQSDTALQRFTRRLGEAAKGKGELLPIIKEYNIQLKDSQGRTRSNVEVLRDFANLIRDTKDPTERLRIAFKLFDSEGAKLANVLADGAEGLDAINDEMVDTNKLISEENVAALKRASDAMTSFGTEMKSVFANATAEVWTTIEAINFLAAEAENDRKIRNQALAELSGFDLSTIPAERNERFRTLAAEQAADRAGVTEDEVKQRMEEIRIRNVKEQLRLKREALEASRQESAALAEAAEQEERRMALEKQQAELTAAIAEHEEQLRYERLDIEDKLAYQLERRAELEDTLKNAVLTEEERNEKLKTYEDTLKRILDLELKIDSAKGGDESPSGGGSGRAGSTDPMQSFADRMEAAQNPQLVILSGMEAMYESINEQVQELINGTITWEQALRNVGGAILSSVISTFAQMAAAAIAGYIVTQLGIKAVQATAMAETIAMGSAAAASWVPAAVAASIATLGQASAIGAAAFAAAMISGAASASLAAGLSNFGMAALGGAGSASGTPGYAEGGLFRGQGGTDNNLIRVSDEEYMMRPEATRFWGVDFMEKINSMQAPTMPSVRLRGDGSRVGSSRRQRQAERTTILNVETDNQVADAMERLDGRIYRLERANGMK